MKKPDIKHLLVLADIEISNEGECCNYFHKYFQHIYHKVKRYVKIVVSDTKLLEGWISLGIKDFLTSFKRLTSIITRPSRQEVWTSIKIGIIGITIIGAVGFIIKFLATMLQATAPTV